VSFFESIPARASPNGFEFTVHLRSVILWPDEPDTV
jgi:hypothetical protein